MNVRQSSKHFSNSYVNVKKKLKNSKERNSKDEKNSSSQKMCIFILPDSCFNGCYFNYVKIRGRRGKDVTI